MMSETTTDVIRRMEGAHNTAPRRQACELDGKHHCGGAVTPSWGWWLCAVGWLGFMDADHEGAAGRLRAWMQAKGWRP